MEVRNLSWATIPSSILQKIVGCASSDKAPLDPVSARCARVCKSWQAALCQKDGKLSLEFAAARMFGSPDPGTRVAVPDVWFGALSITHDYAAMMPVLGNLDVESQRRFLLIAALQGYPEMTDALLTMGEVDPNARNDYGRTPLHLAASQGHREVVARLLRDGRVDCHAKGDDGRTALDLVIIELKREEAS